MSPKSESIVGYAIALLILVLLFWTLCVAANAETWTIQGVSHTASLLQTSDPDVVLATVNTVPKSEERKLIFELSNTSEIIQTVRLNLDSNRAHVIAIQTYDSEGMLVLNPMHYEIFTGEGTLGDKLLTLARSQR